MIAPPGRHVFLPPTRSPHTAFQVDVDRLVEKFARDILREGGTGGDTRVLTSNRFVRTRRPSPRQAPRTAPVADVARHGKRPSANERISSATVGTARTCGWQPRPAPTDRNRAPSRDRALTAARHDNDLVVGRSVGTVIDLALRRALDECGCARQQEVVLTPKYSVYRFARLARRGTSL